MSTKGIYDKNLSIIDSEKIDASYTPSASDYVAIYDSPGVQIGTTTDYIYPKKFVPATSFGGGALSNVPQIIAKSTVEGTRIASNGTQTKTASVLIPGGTITSGDIFDIEAYFYSSDPTARSYSYKILHNTSDAVPADTNILTQYGGTNTKMAVLRRSFCVSNSINVTITSPQDGAGKYAVDLLNIPTSYTTITGSIADASVISNVNWDENVYIVFACTYPTGGLAGSWVALSHYKIVKY